jgi:predicted outer membrane protein
MTTTNHSAVGSDGDAQELTPVRALVWMSSRRRGQQALAGTKRTPRKAPRKAAAKAPAKATTKASAEPVDAPLPAMRERADSALTTVRPPGRHESPPGAPVDWDASEWEDGPHFDAESDSYDGRHWHNARVSRGPRRPGRRWRPAANRRRPPRGGHTTPAGRLVTWSLLVVAGALAAIVGYLLGPSDSGTGLALTGSSSRQASPQDRSALVSMSQAGAWAEPAGKQAQQLATSTRVKEVGRGLAADQARLNNEIRTVATQLDVALPNGPSAAQRDWLDELAGKRGTAYDAAFTERLRAALGEASAAVARVRADTDNELVRGLADRTIAMLDQHMKILDGTGPARVAAPAAAYRSSTSPLRPLLIAGMVAATAALALAGVRRLITRQ